MARTGLDRGSSLSGPARIWDYGQRDTRGSAKEDFLDVQNARVRGMHPLMDFLGSQAYFEIEAVLGENTTNPGANILSLTATHFSIAEVVVPRGGRLISAKFIGSGGIAADGTNFITFTITNKLGTDGTGATVMLAANQDTKAANLNGLTSLVPKSLVVSATAAAKYVAEGDVLEVKAVTSGTLLNTINAPKVVLRFATIPYGLTPLITRILSSPLVGPVDAIANGEITGVLNSTADNNQTAGGYCSDKLDIIAAYGPILRARVKFGTIGANERAILGFASAYNATWDSIVSNAWFRLEGSMALLAETDDGTTDRDDQATGITLVAGTYNFFTIDMSDLGSIKFQVDDRPPFSLAASALLSTDLLQPIIAVQRASGTGVPSWTCDMLAGGLWERS